MVLCNKSKFIKLQDTYKNDFGGFFYITVSRKFSIQIRITGFYSDNTLEYL